MHAEIKRQSQSDQAHATSRPPLPGQRAPDLRGIRVDDNQTWDLHARKPEHFTMIVFYRGLHCPKCQEQLETLDDRMADFRKHGVEVVAISCDNRSRAEKTQQEWDIDNVPLLYDLHVEQARDWGLYISDAIADHEPRCFSEPGLFLVSRDESLYAGWIQSAPFARPKFDDVLAALEFVREKDYPPRGTVAAAA